MKQTEIEALIQLLEDPDEQVFDQVKTKILELGLPLIDELEFAWENTVNPFYQHRIEEVISSIQKLDLKEKVKLWLERKSDDLIHGAILVAKFQYADLNAANIRMQIENIQQAIWLEMQENLTPMEKVNTFNQVFFGHFGFGGNLKNVFNPQNNLINICLERKKGSPIMLGIIYLSIAQNLKLPMYGVDLPYHFALAFCKYHKTEQELLEDKQRSNILFYINPIAKGIIFSRAEIKDYLKRMKVEEKLSYFRPVSNRSVILALFTQLRNSYVNSNDQAQADALQEYIDLF